METFFKLIFGMLIGYVFGKFIGGKEAGDKGIIYWSWFLDSFKIHLHHWITMGFCLLIYLQCFKGDNLLIIGFLLGGITQGLSYSDRFKILC